MNPQIGGTSFNTGLVFVAQRKDAAVALSNCTVHVQANVGHHLKDPVSGGIRTNVNGVVFGMQPVDSEDGKLIAKEKDLRYADVTIDIFEDFNRTSLSVPSGTPLLTYYSSKGER